MTFRVALYYAPEAADPLHAAASAWLGRDPIAGAAVAQPGFPGIADVTAEPRLYGFHATLKPPMRLRPGAAWADVLDAASAIAAAIPPFALPRLAVADLHGFLALRETAPCPELQALADAAVAGADHLRAAPTEDELARRRRHPLPPAQEANLLRWGYPYVFATWFFHMTLTKRLDAAGQEVWRPAAEAHFAAALAESRMVADLCLFTQERGAPFILAERIPLRG
jgi:hypothetical protein